MCSPELAVVRVDTNHDTAEHGCIEVATPPEFDKGMQGIWSPEHLFTASVVSCFMTTFLAIAENSKLEFTAFVCRATGKLDLTDGKLIMTEVSLQPEVTIANANQQELAIRVLQKSEKNCLISNSIRAKVTMTLAVHQIQHQLIRQAN
jgi:organic hydroperoxide reductase OsmC/OhrA